MRTSYTPADLQVGFKASPLPGLGFHLFGGYRVTKDEILPSLSGYNRHRLPVLLFTLDARKGKMLDMEE